MKFKVSTIVPQNHFTHWIAHLFTACAMCDNELIQKIIHQENYNYDESEIDIQLIIEGKEVDINKFLKMLEENFERLVNTQAMSKLSSMLPKIDWFLLNENKKELQELIETSYQNMTDEISKIVSNHQYNLNQKVLESLKNDTL
jgi:hypothetical protein